MAESSGGHIPDPLHHVQDQRDFWEFFDRLFGGKKWDLPEVFGFTITKFMLLELLAALLIIVIFVPIARRARNGALPRGSWWNAFESLLTFVRNEIARPNIGEHDADKFVPFLWTLFLFILGCNLLGMVPFMGSPTASIAVTAALALIAFAVLHGAAIAKMGFVHYLQALWPHIDIGDNLVGRAFAFVLSLMIWGIELFGTVIKSGVLAIRLFANMFAGHMVLANLLLFIVIVGNAGMTFLWPVVTVSSVLGVVALSLLELFVAFLQAYVFTFLTALFMGMSMHPEH